MGPLLWFVLLSFVVVRDLTRRGLLIRRDCRTRELFMTARSHTRISFNAFGTFIDIKTRWFNDFLRLVYFSLSRFETKRRLVVWMRTTPYECQTRFPPHSRLLWLESCFDFPEESASVGGKFNANQVLTVSGDELFGSKSQTTINADCMPRNTNEISFWFSYFRFLSWMRKLPMLALQGTALLLQWALGGRSLTNEQRSFSKSSIV